MVTVVVASFLEQEHIERIERVDGDLRVLYREDLVPPPRWPGDHVGIRDWQRSEEGDREFRAMLAEAEVLYDFPRGYTQDLLSHAPKLRWLQGSMAGAGEPTERAGLVGTDVVVTTASGIYSPPLAEFALLGMLVHAKQLDRLRRDQGERAWREGPTGTLQGKTLCIVGTGSIGSAVAERARPFGVRILGVKRTVREDDEAWGYADDLYETARLHEALGEADYVVLTLPATPETVGLVDAEALAATKRGAYLINIGRGKVVDEAALVEALRGGQLSGAALDVFETEPLPAGSPLWEMGNVIISPHSTDLTPETINLRQAELFSENLRRYLAGEDMINVLDKNLLY
jgi:phosphoglycerate dehydrogenase-like enzyme